MYITDFFKKNNNSSYHTSIQNHGQQQGERGGVEEGPLPLPGILI